MYFKGSKEPFKTFATLLKWLVCTHYNHNIVIIWLIAKPHKMSSIRVSPSMFVHAYMLLDIFPLNYFYSMHIKSSARKNAKCFPKHIHTCSNADERNVMPFHNIHIWLFMALTGLLLNTLIFDERKSSLSDSSNI